MKTIFHRCFSVLFLILALWAISPAQAELYLELTQGLNQAIPIEIAPFGGAVATVPGDQTLVGVIRNDLQNSGQFQVTGENTSADYVLQGNIAALADGRYQVTAELRSAFASAGGSPVLFKKIFTVDAASLRQLAHTLSDLVYEQLTGVKGIFNTKIAYILKQWPTHAPPVYALEVSDADGFDPQTLLISPEPLMSPVWSPNGQDIAYVSFEEHRASIYSQNIHTGQRRLISQFNGINGAPAFSPDGQRMALVLTQKTDHPKIYTMSLNNGQLTQITDGYSIDTEPRWSPDGRSLLFTSDRGGTPQIYQYNFNNAKVTRLTYQGNYNARASFLPDGKTIVMMHRESDSFGIAKQDLVSGQLQVLANTGRDESPSLAPNGKMVLYASQYRGHGVLSIVSIDGG